MAPKKSITTSVGSDSEGPGLPSTPSMTLSKRASSDGADGGSGRGSGKQGQWNNDSDFRLLLTMLVVQNQGKPNPKDWNAVAELMARTWDYSFTGSACYQHFSKKIWKDVEAMRNNLPPSTPTSAVKGGRQAIGTPKSTPKKRKAPTFKGDKIEEDVGSTPLKKVKLEAKLEPKIKFEIKTKSGGDNSTDEDEMTTT